MSSKFLLIMIDGCRPDGLAQASTPHIDSLWQNGAYSWTAQTVMPSVTLASHTSMFRSVSPQKHGIGDNNVYMPQAAEYPSVVDIAHLDGLKTAMFYSWGQLRDLAAPGSFNLTYCRESVWGQDNDTRVAKLATEYLVTEQPDFCFLYLGDVDIWGHASGWMSSDYIKAIETNDAAIGLVLQALDAADLSSDYTILAQSDHGGHEHTHGTQMAEDMTIIWMLNGPGIKHGYEIQTRVNICDTAATIAHVLGLSPARSWEGQPVLDAFE